MSGKSLTTVNPRLQGQRPKLSARFFTDGSELSIRARLDTMRKETAKAVRSVQDRASELTRYTSQQALTPEQRVDQKLSWQRAGRKAETLQRVLKNFADEMSALTSSIELQYDREQGNMLGDMDQLHLVNPTWININGLITNPNQVQMSKRGVGARRKAAAAAQPDSGQLAPAASAPL